MVSIIENNEDVIIKYVSCQLITFNKILDQRYALHSYTIGYKLSSPGNTELALRS